MTIQNPITIEFAQLEALQQCAKLLDRIALASESKNNGLVMGEANLCKYFESGADYLLRQAGVRK